MSIVDTFLVDSTDIANFGRGVTDFSGGLSVGQRRGNNYSIPGLDGEIYVAKPLAAFSVSIGMTILGKDPSTGALESTYQKRLARIWSNYKALVTLCKAESGGTVTLTRKLSTTAGSYTSETCTAECSGGITPALDPTRPRMRVIIEFTNLDGKWS